MSQPLFKDVLNIMDKHGFHYACTVHHHPDVGVSILYHDDDRIDQMEYGVHRPPQSDDDREHEEYQERFMEGIGGDAMVHFERTGKEYFDRKT